MNLPIVYQYLIYAGVIVLGIILLLLLRKASKLPSHRKFGEQLTAHQQALEQAVAALEQQTNDPRLRFFKMISKLLYKTDKLSHTAAALARKERDTDIDNISALLEKVRGGLAPYKFGKKEKGDFSGLEQAVREMRNAVAVMQNVLARDDQLKARSKK